MRAGNDVTVRVNHPRMGVDPRARGRRLIASATLGSVRGRSPCARGDAGHRSCPPEPRARGESGRYVVGSGAPLGRSPCMRGNPAGWYGERLRLWSIPVRAGRWSDSRACRCYRRAIPVRPGRSAALSKGTDDPRASGDVQRARREPRGRGSVPVRAGAPASGLTRRTSSRAHSRARGEPSPPSRTPAVVRGHPRACGEPAAGWAVLSA